MASERTPIFIGLTHGYPFGPRTLTSLGHQVGIATFSTHHTTHSLALSKGCSGRPSHKLGSSSSLFPLKNSSTCGSSTGRPLRSPSLGCDQSAVSGARDGERESSTSMGCDQSVVLEVVSVLESELESSKVTHLLGCTGMAEGVYLFAASPGWPASKGVSPATPPTPGAPSIS